MSEHLSETSLVMIETLLALVVHASDVDDDGAGVQNGGITRPLEVYIHSVSTPATSHE